MAGEIKDPGAWPARPRRANGPHADTFPQLDGAQPGQAAVAGGPQPGGRRPAPGRLAIVQSFVNTHFDLVDDHGAEVLHSPTALSQWLHSAGLLAAASTLDESELIRALAVRESLRALAAAGSGHRD